VSGSRERTGEPSRLGDDEILTKDWATAKCGEVPERMLVLEEELKDEYENAYTEVVNALGPTATAATEDLDRFLHTYFLDNEGRVDIVKAPLALAIPGLVACERLQMHNAARKFGLYTESEGYEDWGSERSLVIGRCRKLVGRLARGGNDSEEGVAVGKEEAGKEEGKK